MGAKIKYTTEEYINLVKEKHKNRYSYPNTIYKGYSKKIEVYCEIHGAFQIEASSHLKGRGCSKCGFEKRTNTREEVIEKAKVIYGELYDYSKVEYSKMDTKVTIICPTHGEFKQEFSSHLKGYGCKKCGTSRAAELVKKKQIKR